MPMPSWMPSSKMVSKCTFVCFEFAEKCRLCWHRPELQRAHPCGARALVAGRGSENLAAGEHVAADARAPGVLRVLGAPHDSAARQPLRAAARGACTDSDRCVCAPTPGRTPSRTARRRRILSIACSPRGALGMIERLRSKAVSMMCALLGEPVAFTSEIGPAADASTLSLSCLLHRWK